VSANPRPKAHPQTKTNSRKVPTLLKLTPPALEAKTPPSSFRSSDCGPETALAPAKQPAPPVPETPSKINLNLNLYIRVKIKIKNKIRRVRRVAT
jgi:hypothetical protein